MTITTNNNTYTLTRDVHCWALKSPYVGVDRATKEPKIQHTETYYPNIGQGLAAIADREMGRAEDVEELVATTKRIREDLMNIRS